MKTDLFDYHLPARLIAQVPTDRRDASRLLVVHRGEHRIEHRHFSDLPEYMRTGDCLFRNNAAVIPARLHATRPTGGQVECLLLRPAAGADENLLAIKAPLLGIFYRRPQPGSPPYVEVGSLVDENTTVALMEVMKLFNPVRAGVMGRIHKICIEDGEPVEYNQVLFLLKPE